MNSKLILRHSIDKNPYGLRNNRNLPMTRKETIAFFDQLKMTDEELNALNEYILEEPSNTFYNNPFGLFHDEFTPLTFLEGYRDDVDDRVSVESNKETYDLNDTIPFYCSDFNEEWEGTLTDIKEYENHISLTIRGAGSKFETLIGYNNNYIWICFPYHQLSSTLAHPDDVLWNKSELSRLFESTKDGITVAYGFRKLFEVIFNLREERRQNEF